MNAPVSPSSFDMNPAVIASKAGARRVRKADDVANGDAHTMIAPPVVSPTKVRGRPKGQHSTRSRSPASDSTLAEPVARENDSPVEPTPPLGNPITEGGQPCGRPHDPIAPFGDPDCPAAYAQTDAVTEVVARIQNVHKLRQGMIRAKNRILLQAMAPLRLYTMTASDFESDDAKKAARKRNEDLFRVVSNDPTHEYYENIEPYLSAMAPLEARAESYAKDLAKLAKMLPVYPWVKSVKGFGDVSFATIVGEAGDIGTYRSHSALWKRMGVAVIDGNRQGNPGAGATAEDWITHGYRKQRRSVLWNARGGLILGMGKWRPVFGDDVWANPDLTYFQKVFADRARTECEKLGKPVKESAKGKDSYGAHAANRALRYCEKRLLKQLRQEWRKVALVNAGYAPVAQAA